MRAHLKLCLEEGTIKHFPILGKRRVPFGSRICKTIVYCVLSCRMPNVKQKAMIACDYCHTWYHKRVCGSISPLLHMSESAMEFGKTAISSFSYSYSLIIVKVNDLQLDW